MKIDLHIESNQAVAELQQLAKLAERSVEVCQRVISLLEAGIQPCCVERQLGPAVRAGEIRFTVCLTDAYAQLLAAAGAVDA